MAEGYVTPAIAIQYILCYRGEDLALAKNAYTVIEIYISVHSVIIVRRYGSIAAVNKAGSQLNRRRSTNLVSEGDLKNSVVKKADLTSYLNRERLNMLFTSKPSEYSYAENANGQMTIVTYQAADRTDGKYYLDFEFVINNTAAGADATGMKIFV